jgi:hypothetical protein
MGIIRFGIYGRKSRSVNIFSQRSIFWTSGTHFGRLGRVCRKVCPPSPTIIQSMKLIAPSQSHPRFRKLFKTQLTPDGLIHLICQYSDRFICNIGTQITQIWIYILDVISNVNIRIDPFATLVPELPKSRIYIYIYTYSGYHIQNTYPYSGYNIQNTYPYLEASRPT